MLRPTRHWGKSGVLLYGSQNFQVRFSPTLLPPSESLNGHAMEDGTVFDYPMDWVHLTWAAKNGGNA